MDRRPRGTTVAAIGLTDDHGWPQLSLCRIVCRSHGLDIQKGEQLGALCAEQLDEAHRLGLTIVTGHQAVERRF